MPCEVIDVDDEMEAVSGWNPPPTCPNDRELMDAQPGLWALYQVMRGEDGCQQTGQLYSASLYRCAACGLLQLYDR